jgi:hypothetical protein
MPKHPAARRRSLSPFDGQMYLSGIYSVPERIPAEPGFPFSLPFVRGLDLDLDRPRFRHRPRDGFFFRAETMFNFATLLEQRDADPDFRDDPYDTVFGAC